MTSQNSNSADLRDQVESEAKQVRCCNTDPTTRQPNPEQPRITIENRQTGGVDYMDISFYGATPSNVYKALTTELAKLQEKQKEQTGSDLLPYTSPAGDTFAVARYGAGTNIHCKYVLWYCGIRIGIVDNGGKYHDKRPAIRVQIPSNPCMRYGAENAFALVGELLKGLGFHAMRSTFARIDVCADLLGIGVEEFCEKFEAGCRVTRAQKWQVFGLGRQRTGFSIGKNIICRAYNKALEVLGKEEKLLIMLERRWAGRMPEKATRVEFQVRAETLKKQLGTSEANAVMKRLPELCEWLTGSWFRLTENPVDYENRHQDRFEASKLWENVRDHFQQWAGKPSGNVFKRMERSQITCKELIVQGRGCLTRAAAKMGIMIETLEDAAEVFAQLMFPHLASVPSKFKLLSDEMAAFSALGSPIPDDDMPF